MIPRIYSRFLLWFTQPESPRPLAWFRMAVALFCLIKMLVVRQSFNDIYGQYGFVQWAITRANLFPGLPHLGDVALLTGHLGLTSDQAIHLVLGVYIVGLCGLLAGLATRWMAVLVWFTNFLWMHAGGGLVYGMDIFAHIALFYLMIMPCGAALSLDVHWRKRSSQPSVSAGVTRRMLQFHMCIIYFSSGLEKAMGIQWWNGEAIWRSAMLPVFHQFDLHWLAYVPWLPMMVGWSTVAAETSYAFLVWSRRTRIFAVALLVSMHFFIGLFLGMWLFGIIMIIMNLGAFGYEAWQDFVAWRASRAKKAVAVAV